MCMYACIIMGKKYMHNVCNIQLSYSLQLEFCKILFEEMIIHIFTNRNPSLLQLHFQLEFNYKLSQKLHI